MLTYSPGVPEAKPNQNPVSQPGVGLTRLLGLREEHLAFPVPGQHGKGKQPQMLFKNRPPVEHMMQF